MPFLGSTARRQHENASHLDSRPWTRRPARASRSSARCTGCWRARSGDLAWIALLTASVATGLALALPAILIFHLAATTVIVNGITTRQVVTPDVLQGRVNTTARLIVWGGSPLGAGLAGVLAVGVGTLS